jgi:hypothetical protein
MKNLTKSELRSDQLFCGISCLVVHGFAILIGVVDTDKPGIIDVIIFDILSLIIGGWILAGESFVGMRVAVLAWLSSMVFIPLSYYGLTQLFAVSNFSILLATIAFIPFVSIAFIILSRPSFTEEIIDDVYGLIDFSNLSRRFVMGSMMAEYFILMALFGLAWIIC